jgi:micrococcal nuclease
MPLGRRLPSLGSILLLIACAVVLVATGGGEPSSEGGAGAGRLEGRVVEVIDGDTARVRVAGREPSVRYIGIDTPESAIPGARPECFGKRAARLNRSLVEGRRVTLVPGAERHDHYGRLLAYVYVRDRLVNAAIVRRGFARTLAIAPNTAFAARFARLQQQAANAGRGLWVAC